MQPNPLSPVCAKGLFFSCYNSICYCVCWTTGIEFPAKNLDTLSPIYTPERVRISTSPVTSECNSYLFKYSFFVQAYTEQGILYNR